MKKLGIAVIHGIGDQDAGYSKGLTDELGVRIDDLGLNHHDIAWEEILWAPVLRTRQEELWRDASRDNDLDQHKIRRFVIHTLADAVAYRKVAKPATGEIPTYKKIHAVAEKAIKKLRTTIRQDMDPGDEEVPLAILAHSLGGHIMSNYIWDLNQPSGRDRGNDFENMKTLSGIVTFGCNIPLFTLAHANVKPIKFPLNVRKYFPSSSSTGDIKKATKWLNYFDPDDVLGWPLKPLSPAYEKTVHEDIDINVGGLLTSWNPASHTQYWTDNSFTKPVAMAIGDILRLL